jgi:hypothetical protein
MSWVFGLVFTAAVLLLGLSLFSHTQRLATDTI